MGIENSLRQKLEYIKRKIKCSFSNFQNRNHWFYDTEGKGMFMN